MKGYPAAQRAYDNQLPAEHFDSLADTWEIKKSKPGQPFFRSLSGPSGEYVSVHADEKTGVTVIEVDCIDGMGDGKIRLNFAPDLVWEDLKAAHEEGSGALARLLSCAEGDGSKAFQDPPDVDEILDSYCNRLLSNIGVTGMAGKLDRGRVLEILRTAYNKGKEHGNG